MAIEGIELAIACARAADDMKAEDIRILDLRGVSNLTDFMLVCSGTSQPHLRAVIMEISRVLQEAHGVRPANAEGKADTRWVVLDYIDVMIHVLDQELRSYYGLEDLWKDAKPVAWKS